MIEKTRLVLAGLSMPTRVLALGTVALGCLVVGSKFVAFAQEVVLPSILRPTAGEIIDGPDPYKPRRPPPKLTPLPRTQKTPAAAQKQIRPAAPNLEATRKVEPNALRRSSAPSLTAMPLSTYKPRPDIDPYAPVGIQAGNFTLRPAFDLDAGYDSNPNRRPGAVKGSSFVKPGIDLRVDSNWAAHSFNGSLRGSYAAYQNVPEANRPDLEAKGALKFDLNRSTNIQADARFKIDTQSPLSTNLPFVTSERPLTYKYGASLGVNHTINRLTIGLRGDVDRTTYDDAKLPGGTTVRQGDRNLTQYGAALRLGYELTPGLKPFVEAKVDQRKHDERVDFSGYRRDSSGVSIRAGTSVEITRTLTGEISAGYEWRKYEDVRLRDLRGVVGDASLIWSVSPLTTIGLRATTTIDEATSPGVSGAITRKATVEIAHALLRNLTITGAASYSRADYKGSALREDAMSGSIKLDYKLSRTMSVRAGFTHERLKSSVAGGDYTANVISAGLRLQY